MPARRAAQLPVEEPVVVDETFVTEVEIEALPEFVRLLCLSQLANGRAERRVVARIVLPPSAARALGSHLLAAFRWHHA